MDQMPDRQSHYYLQLERRFRFLEEWRKVRRELAKGSALRLRESPIRRARLGMLVGNAGGVPTRMIDARVVEIGPGQTTSTHRHMHDAVVFVLEGQGRSTIDGQRVEWGAWDALHTPAWVWHRHTNSGQQRARLLAVTDAPLIEALGLQHFQDVGTSEPPVELGATSSPDAPSPGGESFYEQELVRDTQARTERAGARRITCFKDVTFRVSPRGTRTSLLVDGSLGFRTSGLSMAMFQIPPGKAQARHRHPGEAILYVVEGRGYSIIDDHRQEWESGDALLVNRYCWHQHFNSDPERHAVVIRMHMWESMIEIMQAAMDPVPLYEDEPALRPLGTVTPASGG
jgi:gentisate 1,2-dioxygenase